MKRNPLIESNRNKLTWTAVTIVVTAVIWSHLVIYGNITKTHALVVSIVYSSLLSLSGYLYWFITDYIKAIQARIVIALVNQILIISIAYAVATISGIEDPYHFTKNIPLFATIGILSWVILLQWYDKSIFNEINETEESPNDNSLVNNTDNPIEFLDKISVKEGSHIHIINLNELNYVQAYGDYVMLFTDSGKHIKEQTMRYFETHLPQVFVRIHRSTIVNSEKIARAELFGKESYNIYLKNGTCLKASATGYKLLKERLLL